MPDRLPLLYAARLLAEYKPESIERALELLDEVIAMGRHQTIG